MIYSKKNHNFVKLILIVVAIIFCFECITIFGEKFSPSNAASSFTVDSNLETLTEGGKTYYLVSNAGELAYATKNTDGKNFRVTNNIDISAYEWQTANSNLSFKGNFDGGNYVISGLNINSTYSYYCGLFGTVNGTSTISNVQLSNVNITSAQSTGALVGYIASGTVTINNCHTSNGTIKYYQSATGAYDVQYIGLGGILGTSTASANVKISNCTNHTNISVGSSVRSSRDYIYFGGIVGRYLSSANTLTLCQNFGMVNSYTSNNGVTYYCGGIAGSSNRPIDQCCNYGTITAGNTKNTTISYSGGIVGSTSNTITNCYNSAYINAYAKKTSLTCPDIEDVSSTALGGYEYSYWLFWTRRYQYFYSGSKTTDDSYHYQAYAGGIAGNSSSTISYCYSNGNISGGYIRYYTQTSLTLKLVNQEKDGDGWTDVETVHTTTTNPISCQTLLYAHPICGGDLSNYSNESYTYYSGTIRTTNNLTYYDYGNIETYNYNSKADTVTPWSENDASLPSDGSDAARRVKNVRYTVSDYLVNIGIYYSYDPPNVRGNTRPPIWTWNKWNGSHSSGNLIAASFQYGANPFDHLTSNATNKSITAIDVASELDSNYWVKDNTNNNKMPYLKNIQHKVS